MQALPTPSRALDTARADVPPAGQPDAAPARIPVPRTTTAAPVRGRPVSARMRPRVAPPVDVVVFTARCPACRRDCEWSERREDTRLLTGVSCRCEPATT